jgi:hypothetical protein
MAKNPASLSGVRRGFVFRQSAVVLPVDPARDKGRCQHADGSDERRFGGIFSLRERRVNDGQTVVRFGVSDAG